MFFVEDVYVCVWGEFVGGGFWGEFVGVCFWGGFGVVFCLFVCCCCFLFCRFCLFEVFCLCVKEVDLCVYLRIYCNP